MDDIIGKKFGKLTVIEFVGKRNRDEVYKCKCDCGNVKNVIKRSLIYGNTKSCGCLRIEKRKELSGKKHPNFKDITGKRYGRLVALEPTSERKNGTSVVWKCQCDCGNIAYVRENSLETGRTRSCGCYAKSGESQIGKNVMDLMGKKFGRLTVVGMTDKHRADGCVCWMCKCDCGNFKTVYSTDLLRGRVTSCGCYRNQRMKEWERGPEYKEKQRKNSLANWDDSSKKIGMFDDTNVSLIKSKKARVDSGTGVRGVYKKKEGSYYVSLTFQKKKYFAYGFKRIEDAKKEREKMYEEIVVPYLEKIEHTQKEA